MPRAVAVAGEAVVTSGGRLYCIFYLELQLCLATGAVLAWAATFQHVTVDTFNKTFCPRNRDCLKALIWSLSIVG